MTAPKQLLALLADGELHSGNELAESLGVTRAAVWKHIRQLEALDIPLVGQAGQGYQLESAVELLDQQKIRAALPDTLQQVLSDLHVFWQTPSTSDFLLQGEPATPGFAQACLAEFQSGGRGRRGRPWFAPAGHSICLSVSWRFPQAPNSFSCLGLAIGVAVLRAARAAGANNVQLKWPNDVILNGGKLAGILIDVQGEADGPLQVVAGVGLNYRLTDKMITAIADAGGIKPAALQADGGSDALSRNELAAKMIAEIISVLQQFQQSGFAELADEWLAADYLGGRDITVHTDNGPVTGIARGISADGQLRVESDGRVRTMATGDISVRTG
jgi:BirA family biotin operon repressor/biotin-[acetyl-CoA-carboxylase] ligase